MQRPLKNDRTTNKNGNLSTFYEGHHDMNNTILHL